MKDTTMLPSGTGVSILPPADVSPGHIIFAPLRMNRIAPLSTCKRGSINGSTERMIMNHCVNT